MNMIKATHSMKLSSGHPYVYASYEVDLYIGYVAVIDPVQDTIIKRIRVGGEPGPMCMDPSEKKLYVINTREDSVSIIDLDTFKVLNTVHIGNPFVKFYPNSIFAAPKGNKIYVAHSDPGITIIDFLTNEVIKEVQLDREVGYPFAFAGNEKSSFVYAACTNNKVIAISIDDDTVHPYGDGIELTFDRSRNPLTVHPLGHTQVTFGPAGMLTYFDDDSIGYSSTSSLLDNTVSGIYTDDKRLFCTMREDKNYLKVIGNLAIDQNGIVTYKSLADFPSYKGQDKIRLSRKQDYIGVTVQPTDSPLGGVQIIDLHEGYSHLVELPYVGDMAFFDDTKAYVGEGTSIRPIDVATATALPAIVLGVATDHLKVNNIISGYSKQSL
ncbi:YncE family protein [Paenibacillus silagei]|uniref:YVTN family beta-propeller protein n=1 Tax=Paenibacillus silagei TaxID=1670801 RepID=A0ABS4NNF9_9BACL|nr:YncE family protein [Paenibacillus silagei]MBP2111588.1 YVTN family beta-propeller protein [Paenibacillus silagei]